MTKVTAAIKNFKSLIKRWQWSAIHFAKEFLGVPFISTQQKKALAAVTLLVRAKIKRWKGKALNPKEQKVVDKIGLSIRSGKGTGKDAVTAWIVLWFLACFSDSKIPMLGPSEDHIKDILFAEIVTWLSKRKEDGTPACMLPDLFDVRTDKIFLRGGKHPGKHWFAKIRVARQDASDDQKARTLDGWHADFMMPVVDEAASVNDVVFKSFDTTLTRPVNFVLLIYNPSRDSGYAYETHFKKRSKHWIKLHFDARESELVAKEQIAMLADTYGEDSEEFQVYVCGNPPMNKSGALIPASKIKEALAKEIEVKNEPVIMGIDPARQGADKTGVIVRRGFRVTNTHYLTRLDIPDLADALTNLIIDYEPDRVYIDSIGVGAGVYDLLKRRFPGKIFPVDVVKKSTTTPDKLHRPGKVRFGRLRDELYWRLHLLFTEGVISLVKNNDLIQELGAIREEDVDDGRFKLEGKIKLKKRLGRSPNLADALMLTMMGNIQALRAQKRSEKAFRKSASEFRHTTNSWLEA